MTTAVSGLPRLRAADNRPEPLAARLSLACAIRAVALASDRPNSIGLEGILRAGRAMPHATKV
jgi:hypothetical protein